MRPQSGHRAQHANYETNEEQLCRSTAPCGALSDQCSAAKNTEGRCWCISWSSKVSCGGSVQKHREDLVIEGLFWRHLGAILGCSWCPRTLEGDVDVWVGLINCYVLCKIKEPQENLMIWGLFGRYTGALFLSKNTERRQWFMMLRL